MDYANTEREHEEGKTRMSASPKTKPELTTKPMMTLTMKMRMRTGMRMSMGIRIRII